MRRLAVFAICGTLALSACGDQSRESPTEPTVSPDALLTTCQVTRFPIVRASALIIKVFPAGRLRIEALARAGAIALLWDTCHAAKAQKAAVDFIAWMNLNSARLIGTQAQRNELISLILTGVGVPATVPTASPEDFGVGIFDPANPNNTLVKTVSEVALTELEPGSFLEQTVIVLSRRGDDFALTNFGGNQFPPYFDYDAINASGDKVLKNGKQAIIAFCLLDSDFQTYPPLANRRIGHNPVAGAPGFPFEILEPVDLNAEGLAAELVCPNLDPTTTPIGGFGQGLPGLANAGWRGLGQMARALFLPDALQAATLGTLPPPIGGRAPSLSPFAVVEIASDPGVISNGTVSLGVNPAGQLNASPGEETVGLRFGGSGLDGIAHACLCEGWGVAHAASEASGYANQSQSPQTSNLTLESFARSATEATSVVRVGSTFRVTHHFRPTGATANLYQVDVTVENISSQPLSGVVYRRVVDWDVAPTPFSEYVSIVRSSSLTGVTATNNGFTSADPTVAPGPIGFETPDLTANFFNAGPYDHGAVFDLTLPTIQPGGTNSFVMYYGAAANALAAKTALRSVGAAAVSLARPNVSPLDGTPNTFVLGFSGLGGDPLEISQMDSPLILLRAPALPLMQSAREPHPRNRQ